MKTLNVNNKNFDLLINEFDIALKVKELAERINDDYKKKQIKILIVLDGAFVFAADLIRHIKIPCELFFVKLKSYQGLKSQGKVKKIIGFDNDFCGDDVLIIEDIVDSGLTMKELKEMITEAKTIKIASLLFKPNKFQCNFSVDYVGFEIPDNFVLGYGMDFDGIGRNLSDIYSLK